jgi:hypothetical protein
MCSGLGCTGIRKPVLRNGPIDDLVDTEPNISAGIFCPIYGIREGYLVGNVTGIDGEICRIYQTFDDALKMGKIIYSSWVQFGSSGGDRKWSKEICPIGGITSTTSGYVLRAGRTIMKPTASPTYSWIFNTPHTKQVRLMKPDLSRNQRLKYTIADGRTYRTIFIEYKGNDIGDVMFGLCIHHIKCSLKRGPSKEPELDEDGHYATAKKRMEKRPRYIKLEDSHIIEQLKSGSSHQEDVMYAIVDTIINKRKGKIVIRY